MLAGRLVSRAPLGAAAVNSLSSTIRSFSGLYGTVDSTPRSLETRLEPPATASDMSPEEWHQAWQQQVKDLNAAQKVLRAKGASPLGAAKEAAAAITAVEHATGRLETSLSGV